MGVDTKETWVRDMAMLLFLGMIGLTYFSSLMLFDGTIGSASGFVEELPKAKLYAVPAALTAFFLILALPRPPLLKRAGLSVLSGLIFWLVIWGLIVEFDYKPVRDRGADPEQILIHSRPY